MKLYIAEKASVGQALAAVLPGETKREKTSIQSGEDIVAWASGHLLELREPEEYDGAYRNWTLATLLYVPDQWKLRVKTRGRDLFENLSKIISKELNPNEDVIVNVGDADREGQLLIDEILDYCGWKGKTLRLRINDMNPTAIRKALANMRDNSEYLGEYRAGQARMYSDWLVGFAMTRYVTVSLRDAGYRADVMSVGRVQTPTLGLVVTRDKEMQDFSPSPYYALTAILSLDGDRKLKGRWLPKETDSERLDEQKRITDKEFAGSIVKKLDGVTGAVVSVTKKEHKISPPLPYSLSKLQMAASKKYDITDTLVHVQKLYESKYVTYPRTGCEYIPEDHFSEAESILNVIRASCQSLADMLEGVDLSRKSAAWNDKKITEHHAIIPTATCPPDGSLSQTEQKVYELICARYALQFLPDYEYEETVVAFGADGETFRTSGRTVINLGWQGWDKQDDTQGGDKNEAGKAEEDDDEGDKPGNSQVILPAVKEGESGVLQPSAEEKMTKPPKPYTYHALLAAMNNIHVHVKDPAIRAKLKELQGIGTEATQEGIISTLFVRKYIERKGKIIRSTDLGKMLIDILSGGKSATLTRPDLTALWEGVMGDIETGKASLESFVAEVVDMMREIIADSLKIPDDISCMERRKETVEAPCPLNCGQNARRYEGKFGPFWKCKCSPEVTFNDIGGVPVIKEAREPKVETSCPVKGCKGKAVRLLAKKDSRVFWKCEKCGNFFDDSDGKPKVRDKKK